MAENPLVFPIRDANNHPGPFGLTLRDFFAGQALSSIITVVSAGQHSVHPDRQIPESFALDAYAIADAMLTERAKGGAS